MDYYQEHSIGNLLQYQKLKGSPDIQNQRGISYMVKYIQLTSGNWAMLLVANNGQLVLSMDLDPANNGHLAVHEHTRDLDLFNRIDCTQFQDSKPLWLDPDPMI